MAATTRAIALASQWFDERTYRRTFEPLIADWQREWQEAPRHARWRVTLRGWSAFISAATLSSPHVITTAVPRSMTWQIVRRIAVFCLVASAILSVPMLDSIKAPMWPALVLLALPGGLMMAFPFALIGAVDAIRGSEGTPAHVKRAAVLKLGMIAMIVTIGVGGFVMPVTTRTFLTVTTPAGWNTPEPRLDQLSTAALLTHADRGPVPAGYGYTRAGTIRRELVKRSILTLMPAMFVWLRWTTWTEPKRRRSWLPPASLMTALVIAAFFTSFFGGFVLENRWGFTPGNGLWLPVIVFAIWGTTVPYARRRLLTPRHESPTEVR